MCKLQTKALEKHAQALLEKYRRDYSRYFIALKFTPTDKGEIKTELALQRKDVYDVKFLDEYERLGGYLEKKPMNRKKHLVKRGDSLWKIAREYYGWGSLWPKIREANQENMAPDAEMIFIGEELIIDPVEVPLETRPKEDQPLSRKGPAEEAIEVECPMVGYGIHKDHSVFKYNAVKAELAATIEVKLELAGKCQEQGSFKFNHSRSDDSQKLKATFDNFFAQAQFKPQAKGADLSFGLTFGGEYVNVELGPVIPGEIPLPPEPDYVYIGSLGGSGALKFHKNMNHVLNEGSAAAKMRIDLFKRKGRGQDQDPDLIPVPEFIEDMMASMPSVEEMLEFLEEFESIMETAFQAWLSANLVMAILSPETSPANAITVAEAAIVRLAVRQALKLIRKKLLEQIRMKNFKEIPKDLKDLPKFKDFIKDAA